MERNTTQNGSNVAATVPLLKILLSPHGPAMAQYLINDFWSSFLRSILQSVHWINNEVLYGAFNFLQNKRKTSTIKREGVVFSGVSNRNGV